MKINMFKCLAAFAIMFDAAISNKSFSYFE